MNRWLKSSISIFLGVLILLTGSGLSLAKMVCVKSGYTQFSLSEPDDCCKHAPGDAMVTLEEKCCDISSMDVDILQYLASATQNIQKSFITLEIPGALLCFNCIESKAGTLFRDQNDDPDSSFPPLRIFTKSFLI